MENEIWRPVKGYEGFYDVSNFGRVRALRAYNGLVPGRIKTARKHTEGYLTVGLWCNNVEQSCYVHILVAEAFIGECPVGCEVDHWDRNKRNNHDSNLRYLPSLVNNGSKLSYETAQRIRGD